MVMLLAALLSAVFAQAGAAQDPPAADDAALRIQLRLSDLGYYPRPINGVSDADSGAAFAAFCQRAGVSPTDETALSLLFSPTAPPAPLPAGAEDTQPVVVGSLLSWSEAREKFVAGETYNVVEVRSGIVFHIRYLGGEAHGVCAPASAWDEATLRALFTDRMDAKLSIAVTLDGRRAAASLAQNSSTDGGANAGVPCSLYFSGAASGIGGLPDLEHENAIRIAAGQ